VGDVTKIEWADHTFNSWIGCSKISPACDHCYADALMGTAGRYGRATWGGPGIGEGTRTRTSPANWAKARKWNREAAKSGKPVFVFCASLADVFDNAVPVEWRRDLFELIRATPHLTWLLLTKRPGNIVKLFDEATTEVQRENSGGFRVAWPRNAAIGCTIANQEEADRDIPKLLAAKAALNPAFAFMSMEPLLGPVNLRQWLGDYGCGCGWGGSNTLMYCNECGWRGVGHETGNCGRCGAALSDYYACPKCDGHDGDGGSFGPNSTWLDWVIVGGESGPNARPMDLDWARDLRDQAEAAGVVFNFKQVGGRTADKGGHLLDGREHLDRPEVRMAA
jgi:protein gp37